MIRSAESIPDNIAEGCGAETNIEFGRFLATSIRSTSELESQVERTHGYGLIKDRARELDLRVRHSDDSKDDLRPNMPGARHR